MIKTTIQPTFFSEKLNRETRNREKDGTDTSDW